MEPTVERLRRSLGAMILESRPGGASAIARHREHQRSDLVLQSM
jgi:hypothetical protein